MKAFTTFVRKVRRDKHGHRMCMHDRRCNECRECSPRTCKDCSEFAVFGHSRCQRHLDAVAATGRRRNAERKRKHLCLQCGRKAIKLRSQCRICVNKFRTRVNGYQQKRKVLCLTHYGKDGIMQCCWPKCEVIDPDMLVIDHIKNDGAKDRKKHGTSCIYSRLV